MYKKMSPRSRRLFINWAFCLFFWVFASVLSLAYFYTGTVDVQVYRYQDQNKLVLENATVQYEYSVFDGMAVRNPTSANRIHVDISHPVKPWFVIGDYAVTLFALFIFYRYATGHSASAWEIGIIAIIICAFIFSLRQNIRKHFLHKQPFEFHLPYFVWTRDEILVPLNKTGYKAIGNTIHDPNDALVNILTGGNVLFVVAGLFIVYTC
jgi:hypothetical protein